MASARDSLKPLFGDGVYPEDTIFTKLDLVSQFDSEAGMKPIKNLEYPLNVGTDEINHFVVFNVFSDAEARMMSEEEQQLQNAQSSVNNYTTAGGVVTTGTVMATRVVPKHMQNMALEFLVAVKQKSLPLRFHTLVSLHLGHG